jgi:two-component system, NarL family, response regulator NreC
MAKIRVFVADDHAVLRAGLKLLIDAQSDMEVVGQAATGPDTIRGVPTTKPHVVLLDLSMPGASSKQTIEQLGRAAPGSRVLVLTMHDDPAYLRAALLAGASGYIVKKAADVELLTALRAVYHGRTFVDLTRPGEPRRGRRARRGARESLSRDRPKPLSPRESEVLALLAQGHTNHEAADRLSLSVKTIETHRKRLSDKLGLRSRAELFRFALEVGLLDREAAHQGAD